MLTGFWPNGLAYRYQRMGAGPGQNGKNRDNSNGNRPHEKLDFRGMTPFRHISRFSIRSSELSGKPESHDEDGNNDDSHERDARLTVEQIKAFNRQVLDGLPLGLGMCSWKIFASIQWALRDI